MSKDPKAVDAALPTATPAEPEQMTDAELDGVSGGLNPQPLPPSPPTPTQRHLQ